MKKYESQCQSCGMPLKNGEHSGTEVDGSKSTMYCSLCYENGQFIHNITLEEMKKNVDNALKEKGWIWPLRFMALLQIPSLKRWRK